MKRLILILFVFNTASLLLSAQDTLTIFYDDNWEVITAKEEAAYYRKAFPDGEMWAVRDYFIGDKIQMTGTYKSRKFNSRLGHFIYYYENGQKESEGDYINDKLEGTWTYWFDSGEKQAEGDFIRNNKHGNWQYWYKNGLLKSVEKYNSGLLTSAEIYYKNGALKCKGNYLNFNRSGVWTYYNVDGRVYFSGNYALGLRKGEWVRSFKEGQMIVKYNNEIIVDKEFGGMVKKKWDDNQ